MLQAEQMQKIASISHKIVEVVIFCIHLNVFVLQAITSDSMDIPPEFISGKQYKASLAHKINHSFDPNCR